jgi:outer membrane protein TolC
MDRFRHQSDTCLTTRRTPRNESGGVAALLASFALALVNMLTSQTGAAATPDPTPVPASRPVAAVIDDYVREGLRHNRALQASQLEVERSVALLDAARARFLPEVGIEARYTRAEGGREIELPLGPLVNPIYQSLNELLASAGQPTPFTSIGNPRFPLILEREQDTRLTLRQALYAPAIPAAVRANRAGLEASEFAREATARRLKRDISAGYLNWLQASKAVEIVDASRLLLAENLRVNESLFRNGKITQDQVLRANAELLAVEQQLQEARAAREQAERYVNFLLGRALDTPLEPATLDSEIALTIADLDGLRARARDNRPELAQADRAVRAAAAQTDIASSARRPTLSLGVDAGTQGERYEFGRGRNFATVSLLLNWALFDGGSRASEVSAARASERRARTQRDELAQQIELEVRQSLDQLETTASSLRTAAARTDAARAAFRIASRKRDEGVISQVEFIDARSALTGAELNLNVTRFQLLARQADLDFATAAGSLPFDSGVAPP